MRLLAAIPLFLVLVAKAQFGQYQSLDLPAGTRSAALGGVMVSQADGELMQFMNNPAVLDSVAYTDLSFNYNPYFSGINVFSGAYHGNFGKAGPFAIGLTYLNYGDFTETDDSGNEIGTFSANDYVLALGRSHQLGLFTMGVNMKLVHSSIESYSSSMMAFDIGGIYRHPVNDLTFGLVFKNLGFKFSDYYADAGTNVPFDVQMGVSIKPEYMPFRFTLTAYNLVEENLVFTPDSEEQTARTSAFFDKMLRRVNIGTELILNQNLQLHLGYNHLRRQELKLDETSGGSGFSYGISIGIKKVRFRYARATYHVSGAANFISLETNLNAYKKIL